MTKHFRTISASIIILVTGFSMLLAAQKPANKKNDSLPASGKASFYANMLHGFNTSSGDLYDKNDFTCAHRTLPFNTILSVTNITNGKIAIVRVNDRGPYRKGRILDLSRAAAKKIGMLPDGVVKVRMQELTFLDFFPINDSLLHNGEVVDTHGKQRLPKTHMIRVWGTPNLKHAVYMATNMEIEYKLESVYIRVSGNGENRNYILYIPNVEKKEDGDKLIAVLKLDGFSLCRFEKN